MATAAIFATQTSSFSESRPLRTTFDQMSCATAPDAESTRPATTARIVAKATAGDDRQEELAAELVARLGNARLPPVPAASSPALPRNARAPNPRNVVIR